MRFGVRLTRYASLKRLALSRMGCESTLLGDCEQDTSDRDSRIHLQRRTYSARPVNSVGLSGVHAGESGERPMGMLSKVMITAAQYAPLSEGKRGREA